MFTPIELPKNALNVSFVFVFCIDYFITVDYYIHGGCRWRHPGSFNSLLLSTCGCIVFYLSLIESTSNINMIFLPFDDLLDLLGHLLECWRSAD